MKRRDLIKSLFGALLTLSLFGRKNTEASQRFAYVDYNKCRNCGKCIGICHKGAISYKTNKIIIDKTKCSGCGACANACNAISMK